MKIRIVILFLFSVVLTPAWSDEAKAKNPLQMKIAEVYDFSVSLMELRERTQHKKIEGDELKLIATAFASARFVKEVEHLDVAGTPYVSRFQFRHGFLGGTPRTGQTESGILTVDCKTFYWDGAMFTIDEADAAALKKLFPQPKNPLTKSELLEYKPD